MPQRLLHKFKIDRVDLQHARDPQGTVAMFEAAKAREFGEQLAKEFPYKCIPYEGEIPAVALTKDHQFKDTYELDIVVFRREEFDELITALREDGVEIKSFYK